MSRMDYGGDGDGEMSAEQRNALDQLHGWITHGIAEAHLTGDRVRLEQLTGQRGMISNGLSAEPALAPAPLGRDERDLVENRRVELTRELHDAVAQKDSYRAGRLDRERNELTEGLYGNGEIVGASGRSL